MPLKTIKLSTDDHLQMIKHFEEVIGVTVDEEVGQNSHIFRCTLIFTKEQSKNVNIITKAAKTK